MSLKDFFEKFNFEKSADDKNPWNIVITWLSIRGASNRLTIPYFKVSSCKSSLKCPKVLDIDIYGVEIITPVNLKNIFSKANMLGFFLCLTGPAHIKMVPFTWFLHNILRVNNRVKATEYETCAICTGFIFCSFLASLVACSNFTLNLRSLSFKYVISFFCGFVALRPKSTAMVMAGQSVHLTTPFPGQAWTSS